MNEFEIDESLERYRNRPVLDKATRFLSAFRDEVNQHSDGWPYWTVASKAAKKLTTMIHTANMAQYRNTPDYKPPTDADLKAAISPIRSFYTRRGNAAGMKFPDIA